ncbi:MAG: aminoacyl-tRNA hydrolase [Patescibacteria group bacterium]|mgnify:CR=1 FL=1
MKKSAPVHTLMIVGLGNPGKKYASTYHNVGQQFLHFLLDDTKFSENQPFFKAQKMHLGEQTVILLEPKTFMNESGGAIASALNYFRLPVSSLLIVHDDFDLPLGEFRLSQNRGSAGHRGVDSIITTLKTKAFLRARIGVRSSSEKAMDLVLRPVRAKDKKMIQGVFAVLREKVIVKV